MAYPQFSFKKYDQFIQQELSRLSFHHQLIWGVTLAAKSFQTYNSFFCTMNLNNQGSIFRDGVVFLINILKTPALIYTQVDLQQKLMNTACLKIQKKLHDNVPGEAGLLSIMGTGIACIDFAKTEDTTYLTSAGFARFSVLQSVITHELNDTAADKNENNHPLLQAEFSWQQELITRLNLGEENKLIKEAEQLTSGIFFNSDELENELPESSHLAEPRSYTFSDHEKLIKSSLEKLSFPQAKLFGIWICERLFEKYHAGLKEFSDQEVALKVSAVQSFVNAAAASSDAIDFSQADIYSEQLKEILQQYYVEFDPTEAMDIGMLKLLEGLESVIAYMQTPDLAIISRMAETPIEVIDVIMTNELMLDTNDPNKHINHPLMKTEMTEQIKKLQQLGQEF